MIQSSKKIELHRNSGIDVLRGLCIFGVLWHHSCLYLGTNFLPMYMKQLSFLLEVPAIFFVSGMTMRFINRDMIVNGIFKLSLSFTLAYLLLIGFGFFGNITNFWQPLFFQALPLPKFFSVLDGSYW
ncbi:MAG: hypothetical protein J6W96_04170, partial [Alphaproteobacteria bacterium]|nr:hypothetical protein [Alphaproteobacteria bacterium]